MAMNIIKSNNFSADDITFSEVKPFGTNGGKQVYVNYKNNQIRMQTPKMRLPYGMGKYEENGKPTKYSLDFSFSGIEDNEKISDFHKAVKEIDEKIIAETTKKYSLQWFKKKKMSEEVARTVFTPSIKRSKDKETGEFDDKYPPTFKAKMPVYENNFACSVFDHKKGKIENDSIENSIKKGQSASAIIKCAGVWFSGGKYGVSWKVDQLKLSEHSNTTGYMFLDSEDESEEMDTS
tara:strand:- start:9777 stop:10481 length:705 start_codon:yes stop_codon:yes gene_type:complete